MSGRVPGCDGAGAAMRSYPTSKSEAAAESARLRWHRSSREELSHDRGQGRRPGGATSRSRSGAAAGRSNPTFKVRGGREELSHARGQGRRPGGATPRLRTGAAAGRSNPTSKSSGCTGARGPRGATPRSRSGGAVVRRYPSSKVRSHGCALLEQP